MPPSPVTAGQVIDLDELLGKLPKVHQADVWARRYLVQHGGQAPKLNAIVDGVRSGEAQRRGLKVRRVRPISPETARQGLALALVWLDTHAGK